MLHKTRNLVENWRKGDAEKLARLEVESQSGWPGGGSWQTTPEDEERNIRESNLLGAFVTESRNRLIAICTIRAKPGQTEHAFVPYLNCRPDYHGKKHGKTVLRAAVERAYQEGYGRVDLYTWPGNLKSVPLYKKMGFMWQPDSSVHMENFTPAARSHPLGLSFFATHDWYDTQVRSLELEEDLVRRGKVRVYDYLWRAEDGEFLRMVFDRQGWGVLEVENRDLMAACSLPDEKLVAGMRHTVRWRITNKRSGPVHVLLSASGDPGIEIQTRETLEVRDTAEVEGTFTIDPEIPEKTREPRAAILKTDVMIDGSPVALSAGIQVQQAVGISIDHTRSVLVPGLRQEATLTLRSNLDGESSARLSVLPKGGATVHRRNHTMPLGPRRGAELPLALTAEGVGPVAVEVQAHLRAKGKRVPVKTKRIDLLAVEREGASGCVGEDHALLAGPSVMVRARLKGGYVAVYDRLRARAVHRVDVGRPMLGPPFSREDLFDEKAEASIEHDASGPVLLLRTKSILRPGVSLERRIGVSQGPLAKVVDTVINRSSGPVDLCVQQGWGLRGGARSELVVPRGDGVIRDVAAAGGRGLRRIDLLKDGKAWPEGWICAEGDDGCAVGMIWGRAELFEPHWRGGDLRLKVGRVGPGESGSAGPVYGFAGDGNWQTVRGWWQTLFGAGAPDEEVREVRTRRPIELALNPSPLVVGGVEATARLSLRSAGEHKLDGQIALDPPSGLRTNVKRVKVSGLCAKKAVARRLAVSVTVRSRPGPASIAMRFETEEALYRSSSRVLVLPRRPADVRLSREDGGRVIVVDNGILAVKVAPRFMGSVVSLVKDGREYLLSAVPRAAH